MIERRLEAAPVVDWNSFLKSCNSLAVIFLGSSVPFFGVLLAFAGGFPGILLSGISVLSSAVWPFVSRPSHPRTSGTTSSATVSSRPTVGAAGGDPRGGS